MGGKLLAGIFRGNRTTNVEGIAAFRDRARTTLNPPPKPPAPATLKQDALYGGGGFPSEQQPAKGKAKTKKRRNLADLWRTMPEGLKDQIFSAYAAGIEGGIGGSMRSRTPYRAPPIGSRSAQRGFVGAIASGPAGAARAIGQEQVARMQRARAVTPKAAATRAQFDPKWGEELEPAIAPIQVPKRAKYSDLDLVEVPHRERFADLDPIAVPQRTKYGSGAGSGYGNGAQRAGGSTRTAGRVGRSTVPGTGKAGGYSTGASPLSLHLGPFTVPLEPIIRAATTRKPSQRLGTARAAQPFPSTSPQPQFEFAPSYIGPASTTKDCDCSHGKKKPKKERKPRSECREGRYTQTSKGVKYRPDRIVPCT